MSLPDIHVRNQNIGINILLRKLTDMLKYADLL